MVIDKKLDLDRELEYFKDGSLSFAQNVVLSKDTLAFQNEPALVNFVSIAGFTLVGFIACNEEFVLFGVENNDESVIYRIDKYTEQLSDENKCKTNWKWQGGEVFGTFTYNVNNELIIAISERGTSSDCPLKIINLDRDKYIEGSDDNIYTLTPNIPKANMIDIEYVLGNRIKKGKYNFFIKYHIEDIYETGWFPIGVPVFIYDNLSSNEIKPLIEENIQVVGDIDDNGVPKELARKNIKFGDYYNKDDEYTNNNVLLDLEIFDTLKYTHYTIGYIVNTTAGIEGCKTTKFNINTNKIQIGIYSEPISIDELTINHFNIYNVNTLCNYKNRLYLANYKEENRNNADVLSKIDVSKIQVHYNKNDIEIPEAVDWSIIANDDFDTGLFNDSLKKQWKSKPGRFGVYNFFIHYVYPNGNYTDGIKIGNIDNYKYTLIIGVRTITTEPDGIPTTSSTKLSINIDSTTTTDYILDRMTYYENYYNAQVGNSFVRDASLDAFCKEHSGKLWYTIEYLWIEQGNASTAVLVDDVNPIVDDEIPTNLITLSTYCNSKGEILFRMPTDEPANTRRLWFTGIKMYPEFVGYFISYEEPEYIQIGEGFLASDGTQREEINNKSLYPLKDETSEFTSTNWRFYYPEFNIVGGKTNITKLYNTGNNTHLFHWHSKNDFVGSNEQYDIVKSMVVAPNDATNIGREGYLKVRFSEPSTITHNITNKSFTAINNNYNIYLSDNKKLISLGYIEYQTYNPAAPNNTYRYGYKDVPYNYDFYRCFSSIIFFAPNGIIVNQTSPNPINASSGEEYYQIVDSQLTDVMTHVNCINYWHETHYPLFLKEINQEPESIFYSYYRIVGKKAEQYQLRNYVANPMYINDLYKLDNVYYDYTGKLYVNYDETAVSSIMNNYTKTVRRSDVIQSESIINSWKYFRPENYKVITENKGEITNIVGIGNYLFVHCEHSLFMFDITDSLQALDKNVQLLQPDSFEVAYKEVFTAEKGYGGLQDFDSWICDEFGYIFYDKSAKSIYRFDGGKLVDMTDGMDRFMKLYNPNYVLMGNDRFHDRILFNFGYNKNILDKVIIDNVIVSYNLITNSWTSTHSYTTADKFINIKDKLYLIDRNVTNEGINTSLNIIQFDYINEIDAYTFNNYSVLPKTNILATYEDSSFVDIVFTGSNYNKIKVLDFITYIINKDSYDDGFSNIKLEIFTNCCYSGIIDISQERKKVTEYKKPYYDYERWNFNWFRNILDKFNNGEIVNRLTGKIINYEQKVKKGYDNALITGKYVVIRFIFKNTKKPVFIKDIHAYFKP